MLSKSLIQFSVDGWGCVLSLFFDLRPNYGGGNESKGHFSAPYSAAASARDCWTLTDKLWGHCSFLLGPGVHKVLFVPSKSLFYPALCKF